ncbi:SprT-like domain-containing protein [Natronococcus sp. A-GB1]|uniref:SprT-like domain-containing protein n=1 Tax=Natronococcus sp. A-GB1 TaxID=3037648 RepID=UPI00242043D5|nr:SprT-like domain-containing protein [Natronococcus sp. A-GB1]MDG5762007.1 SprT-like domain-containing protein [Natronococcus sp. A-GB1]
MSTEQLSLADALEAATDSETADSVAERELDEPETKAELRARAASHAADVAGEHFPELPVESINWETSTQMQRSAGKAGYNRASGQITIRLSWDAYREYGWQKFARTVRHELIHAYQFHKHGEADHGPTFTRWVDPLDTDRHCERFADPKYWIVCDDCEKRDPRYQRSKIVKNPGNYRCQCGGDLRVEDA